MVNLKSKIFNNLAEKEKSIKTFINWTGYKTCSIGIDIKKRTYEKISKIEEEKVILQREKDLAIFNEGRILKRLLKFMPHFGCPQIKYLIERETSKKISGLDKLYEYTGFNKEKPNKYLLERSNLLFIF